MTPGNVATYGWLRALGLVLTVWEPVTFAVMAAGAFNAITVRGLPVAMVLLARLVSTAFSVAAGRALSDRRPSGRSFARAALALSAGVQLFAYLTPYFPSNRMPGETPAYVAATIIWYGAWFACATWSN
jgi:hypothetical protein